MDLVKSTLTSVGQTSSSWSESGRPSKKSMVKNPPPQPSQLGDISKWSKKSAKAGSTQGSPR